MAALTVGHCYKTLSHELTSRNSPKIFVPSCCQGRRPVSNSNHDEEKKGKLALLKWKLMNGFDKFGKKKKKRNPQQNLSPQQKGDWKDLFLMSISFAVYVYISQKLVCAYCAWTSMPKRMW